ncbi:MAG: hypothetical protein QXX19_07640 [Candidatus Caldarchaeum sp.]
MVSFCEVPSHPPRGVVGRTLKVAVTDLSAFIMIEHVLLVPLQAPLQPLKVEPESAVAVKVTVAGGVVTA